MTDPWARPPDRQSASPPPDADPATPQQPPDSTQPQPAEPTREPPPESTQQLSTEAAPVPSSQQPPPPGPPSAPPPRGRVGRLLRDPLSIVLIVVIVLALALAGVVGVELWARSKANNVVATSAACVVQDTATASFDGAIPFLWQHLNRHYGNISITTGGNQIRDMKGMKADIRLDDVRIADSGDSKGTIGALTATITWTADGIRQTVQQQGPTLVTALQEAFSQYGGLSSGLLSFAQPLIESASRNLVTDVTTDPSSGSVVLSGTLGHLTVTPKVENGRLTLTPSDAGFSLPLLGDQPLPSEAFEPLVNRFTDRLAGDLPLGVQPSSLTVTDTGIVAVFSTTNAAIPKRQSNDCFRDI